jgi:hypothetical protein
MASKTDYVENYIMNGSEFDLKWNKAGVGQVGALVTLTVRSFLATALDLEPKDIKKLLRLTEVA